MDCGAGVRSVARQLGVTALSSLFQLTGAQEHDSRTEQIDGANMRQHTALHTTRKASEADDSRNKDGLRG